MESSSQYLPQPSSYLQSTQLPSPSELGLTYPNNNNALSPILSPTASQYPAPAFNRPPLSKVPTSSTQNWSGSTSPSEKASPPLRHQEIRPKPEPDDAALQQQAKPKHEGDEGAMPATSDFVKKLYRMLEDGSFSDVVCWGPHGDCFVIKDLNEFTKSILPRMFKHSNFASFVRQLNKYDFHKVKNTDDNEFGEHIWMFRHPDFHVGGREALEHIKRKVPGGRKACQRSGSSPSPTSAPLESMKVQLERMSRQQEEMTAHIRNLETEYENVLGEMVTFQRNLSQQDGLMQNLVQYFLQLENAKLSLQERGQGEQAPGGIVPNVNPFLQVSEAQQMMGGPSAYPEMDIARASLGQMSEISRRAESAGMSFSNVPLPGGRPSSSASLGTASGTQTRRQSIQPSASGTPQAGAPPASRQEALARIAELSRTNSAQGVRRPALDQSYDGALTAQQQQSAWGMSATASKALAHEGLQVYTVGHLMPRSAVDDANGNWTFDPASVPVPGSVPGPSAGAGDDADVVMPTPQGRGGDPAEEDEKRTQQPLVVAGEAGPSAAAGGQTLRVRRSTYVPIWAVPPKVLLVDDDIISRKLSSRFLQVFGCTIDVAVDGVSAVNKMNLEKYDLVLMDIVMPKLDGISATSLIRQFDPMTPIISMTSNAKPTEIIKYYSSGMNDILPKPFTKDGLLGMLEKHLTHLKVIQTMASKLPRSVGLPPMSDASFAQALAQSSKMVRPSSRNDGRVNPLAGMGLSDEQYTVILQNLVSNETFDESSTSGGSRSYAGKRGLEESGDDHYNSKRSRFEEIE